MRRITYFSSYFKSLAKYKPVWEQIQNVMERENEVYEFISNINDIWVRDFMPFQRADGEFLIYRYNPDYLQRKDSRYVPNCRDAFIEIGGRPVLSTNICHHTNLVIDGGNMIKCKDKNGTDCVIMTIKVLYENPNLTHHEILLELEDNLNAEIILIPWDCNEPYGHVDGMVRSIGEGELLLNCYSKMDRNLGKAVRKSLGNRFEIYELSYGDRFRDNSWCHLNYLELERVVLVPMASIASDSLALKQIEKYIGKKTIPIRMSPIIKEGGAMHCISWSIDAEILFENQIIFEHPMFLLRQ